MVEELDSKVKEIVEKIYHKKHPDDNLVIAGDTSLRSIGFDSFDLAVLTVNIEDVFEVDIFENKIVDTIDEIKEEIKNGMS